MDEEDTKPPQAGRLAMPRAARKKFAKPPVKVACLACRASRIRCDGGDPCATCHQKGKECSYLPSKRGGPRKKRIVASAAAAMERPDGVWNPAQLPMPRFDEDTFTQLDILAVPGAGLRQLDFPAEIETMFGSMLAAPSVETGYAPLGPGSVPILTPPREPTRVRLYGNERDILSGYYTFIHHYFPIFPPPFSPPAADCPLDFPIPSQNIPPEDPRLPYRPQSPVTLAISAILARIPHPSDPDPSAPESILLRRAYSHKFARAALESVETDSELSESISSPSQALQNEKTTPSRLPVHPHTPVDLEGILALLVLSIYEYTQRGNLVKMRHRAGQAYVMAMNMSLHALGPDNGVFAEAKRRTWWMTFYCICQGSIVSTTPPTIVIDDPRFVTPYPNFAADPEAWSILMQSQRVLVAGTQYIIDLNRALQGRTNMSHIYERMKKLDAWARAALAQTDAPPSGPPTAAGDYYSEAVTADSIRSISRIKLSSARIKTHRFRAFFDIPIFIKKHCDLTCASIGGPDKESSTESDPTEPPKASCCSGNLTQIPTPSPTVNSPSPGTSTSDASKYHWLAEDSFPFESSESTNICLQSALTIARMFRNLPYPQPIYRDDPSHLRLPPELLPRTMPSFACCAMQSSYAMLMLYYKSNVVKQEPDDNPLSDVDQLGAELKYGLECVINAVKNYSIAFEALDGMRDEIEGAYITAFPQP